VLLLSHLITASQGLKQFVLTWLSFTFAWTLVLVPIGMFLVACFGFFSGWHRAGKVGTVAIAMFVYGALPIAVYEDVANLPWSKRHVSLDARISTLGGIFILEGLMLQLWVAWREFAG